uniref:Uncharacterized protein n=1 Tax=Arundo donax TaxID=35708 RepID=A0A0A9HRG8_ARUDO
MVTGMRPLRLLIGIVQPPWVVVLQMTQHLLLMLRSSADQATSLMLFGFCVICVMTRSMLICTRIICYCRKQLKPTTLLFVPRYSSACCFQNLHRI